MRRIVATVLIAFTIAGCVPQPASEKVWSSSNMREPSRDWSNDSDENTYLNLVANEYPDLIDYFGEHWIVEFAYNTCASIEEGVTWKDMQSWDSMLNTEMPDETKFLIAGAVTVFCPDYEEAFLG